MPGAMIYGSVGNSDSRLRFFQQLRDISDAVGCSLEDTWNMIVNLWRRWIIDDGFPSVFVSIPPVESDPTTVLVRFAWMLLCLVCLHLSRSDPFQLYERRGRELLGLPPVLLGSVGAWPGTNNSIDLTLQEYERSLRLWPSPGLGRPLLNQLDYLLTLQRYWELVGTDRVVINNSIVLSQSDLREPLGFHGDPLATSNGIALRQSYPNQLYRQPNWGISWMMRDGNGITVEAVDLEARLINGENRRMTESSQEHNLFDSNQLPKVVLGITCQAVFSLLGALALINTQFSLEFKILAIVLAFGFISSLVSMLISKGKLRKSLIKVGAVSVSSAVIIAVAMLLRVDKMWMWVIAGAVSVLPLITVIRS